MLAKATKPHERSGSWGPFFLIGLLSLALASCASVGELEAEEKSRKEVDRNIITTSNSNNEAIARDITRLHKRIYVLEAAILGEWDRPECDDMTPRAQALFCTRKRVGKNPEVTAPPGGW